MRELSLPSRGSFSRARFFLCTLLPRRLLRRLLYTRLAGSLEQGSMITIKNCVVFFFQTTKAPSLWPGTTSIPKCFSYHFGILFRRVLRSRFGAGTSDAVFK